MIKTGKLTVKYTHSNWHKIQGQTRYMTIFHLLAGIIFGIAFMQGKKADVLGMLIGSVIGVGAALAFFYGNFIFFVWLPKRLGIFELVRYSEEAEEVLSAKEKVLSTIYGTIILLATLIWFILCAFCSYYFSKLLLTEFL
jgi:hypothetical protein